MVAADRCQAARALLEQKINVVISDDGLQHYKLPRSLEICVVDGSRGFGNGSLIPAGPLREPLERLSSVDHIISNGVPESLPEGIQTDRMVLDCGLAAAPWMTGRAGAWLNSKAAVSMRWPASEIQSDFFSCWSSPVSRSSSMYSPTTMHLPKMIFPG